MLWKGVYPYEYTNVSEKVNETLLPENEVFCSHLTIEEITDADYTHKKSDDERYFLEVYNQYLYELHEFLNNSPFLLERIKIGKVGKLVFNLHG